MACGSPRIEKASGHDETSRGSSISTLYSVHVDFRAAETITARYRVPDRSINATPLLLVPATSAAFENAVAIQTCDGEEVNKSSRIAIDDKCIEIVSKHNQSATRFMRLPAPAHGRIVQPTDFLWRLEPNVDALFIPTLSADTNISVAWPRHGDGYILPAHAFSSVTNLVVTRDEVHEAHLEVDGPKQSHNIHYEWLPIDSDFVASRVAYGDYFAAALRALSTFDGPFPATRFQFLLYGSRGNPVSFGFIKRGGAPSIAIFVNPDAALPRLKSDWTLVHELSHLLHPTVSRSGRWLTEGIATYYQEILRARAGLISKEDALHAFEDGFSRARASARDDLKIEDVRRNYTQVYWHGAAFAMAADLWLHEQGSSLDAVLAAHKRSCPHYHKVHKPPALAKELGLSDLYQRYVSMPSFPETKEMLVQLKSEQDVFEHAATINVR